MQRDTYVTGGNKLREIVQDVRGASFTSQENINNYHCCVMAKKELWKVLCFQTCVTDDTFFFATQRDSGSRQTAAATGINGT